MRQLYYFNAIAEEGSISRAAARLHLSQPPLTIQIQHLEAELGVALLKRHKKGVVLTAAGVALAEEAKAILARAEQSMNRVRQVGRGEVGVLRIGVISSVMWGTFAQSLRSFANAYPQVSWSLHELNPKEQIRALQDKQIDVGLWRSEDTVSDDLVGVQLTHEFVAAALPTSHPLAQQETVELKALAGESIILMSPEVSEFAARLIACCREAGFEPKTSHRANAPETLMSLVASGAGVSLLPEVLKRVQWPGVSFVSIVNPQIEADLYLFARKADTSPLISNFTEVMLKELIGEGCTV